MSGDEGFKEAFAQGEPVSKEDAKPAEAPKAQEAPAEKPAETGESKEPPPEAKEPEKPKIEPEQFKGYLDEREKRQSAEREAADLKKRLETLERQQQERKAEPPPDIYENPEGYRQHFEAQNDQRLLGQKMQISEFMARKDFGDELFDKVKVWAAALPPDRANPLIAQASPFHAAVDAYRQEQALGQLREHGYDLDKFVAARTPKAPASEPQAQPQAAPPAPAAGLPPKVAGQGGAAKDAPQMSDAEHFSSVFRK